MTTIEFDGIEDLRRAIIDFPDNARPLAEKAMLRTVELVTGRLEMYPPQSEANRPGRMSLATHEPLGYYERLRGWWYPIKGAVPRTKSEGGRRPSDKFERELFSSLGISGYKLRATSQRLKESWATALTITDEYILGEIGSRARYWRYVVGMEQARMHASRGWPRVDHVIEDCEPDIRDAWLEAVDGAIELFCEE